MKCIISLFFSLLFVTTYSQSITVNDAAFPESSLTAEELIQNVLISGGSDCAEVVLTNLQENPGGIINPSSKSWGYFNSDGTNFPFDEGIILTSGFAELAEGPNDDGGGNSGGSWAGDPDLQAILDNLYGTTEITNDATVFEFTFESTLNTVDFEFIFASEEYENEFECDDEFRDGFAFLVRGPGLPDDSGSAFGGTNIAAIPGSTNVPVSTATIHLDPSDDPTNGFLCGSEILGTNYFPEFYISNSNDNINDVPVQFDGLTTVLVTSTISIIPNQQYTIKMVIGDRRDSGYDSAVFLKAGSLNVGVELGDDLTVSDDTAICQGETTTLDATGGTTPDPMTTFEWQQFNTISGMFEPFMPAETDPLLDVSVMGEYKVIVTYASGCTAEDSIIVEVFNPAVGTDATETICTEETLAFDLNTAVSEPSTFSWTVADNPDVTGEFVGTSTADIITDTLFNTSTVPQDVVYTVTPTGTGSSMCTGADFTVTVTVNPGPVMDSNLDDTACSDTSSNIVFNTAPGSTPADSYTITNIIINGGMTASGGDVLSTFPATGLSANEIEDDQFTNTTGIVQTVIYTVTPVTIDGCEGNPVDVTLTVQPKPVGDTATSNQEICTTETLGIDLNTTVSLPSTFTWEAVDNPDVMGETLTPGSTSSVIDDTLTNTSVTDTTVEYIITPTASGAANCTGDPYSIFVTVVATPVHDAIADQEECDTFTFPAITQMGVVRPNAYFSLNADGTGTQFAQGENITYFDFFPNQYPVTIYTYEVTSGMAACENPVNAFTLTIVRSPEATIPAEYPLCDDGADDTENYDLTSRNAEVLGTLDPATHSVIWFENAADANDQTAVSTIPDDTMHIFNADFPLTDPPTQVVYARVTETSSGIDCFDVVPLTLVLNPNPVLFDDMATFEVCDDNIPDGIVIVDLSVNDQDIAGPNTPADVTVSYHETPQDAVDGTNAVDKFNYQTVPPPYPYTLYTRVTDNITGCHSEGELAITVLQSPAVVAPTPYELCDLDNDGVATFMLSTKNDEIFAGDPTLTIAYYLTQAEAEADPANPANALDQSAYTNATPFSETVWARVENAAGCVTVVPVDLIVLDTPMPNDTPADYALCDFDQDGQEVFDLPSRNMDVLGGLDPVGYSVTWYADLTNAQNGTPDIPDATNYASTGGDVYAVVRDETQSATTFCEAIVTLTLVVEPIPVPVQPVAYELCDDEASGSTTDDTSIFDLTTREPIIIDGNTDWDVTWYTTEVGADTADPAALIPNPTMYSYTNMMVNVPVWARVADTSTQNSCHATVSLTLVVQPNPSPSAIPDVEECDGNDGILDGQATFDLTDEAIAIANGEMVVITFHETEQNAIDNMDAINEMAYTSGTRTLWARSTEDDPATATECFTIVAINLIVRDTPEITATMADLELTACDDADGTMDGTATFDLTVNDALIYGTLNPADYDLTYHESQVSAEADLGDPDYNIDIIATPAAYTFGPPATGTVWVRLQDTTQPNTLCAAVTSFTINVGATPVYTVPEPEYFACDSLDSGDDMDGIATFDLTLITADITASNPDLTVAYYASPADIPLGNDIQPQDAYQGTGADPQTITIVITSTQAGMCEVIESTDLRVNPVPQLISDPLPEAIACDPDNDDFSDFDLDAYALLIVNGQTGIDILFYETLAAAENGDPADAIVNTASYDNIVPNQVLYALATDTNNATACAKIFPFTLLSHPTPLVTPGTVDDLTDCDDDGDGQEVFDLTVQDNPLLAIQTPANDPAAFTVSYHNTQASADDITDPGVPDAANYPVTVVGSPETIFVRVRFNDGSDCFSTTSFDVIVDPLPVIGAYTNDLEVCDDDIDQIAVFDLTTNEDEITVDPLLQVDYYETMADITAGTPIVDPTMFTNTTNPQTIFVVVTSQAGCTVQTQRELRVLPLPSPDEPNPEDVVVCDDDFDGFFDFDLTPTVNEIDPASAPTIIRIFETFAQAESYDAITNTPAPATDAAAGYLYTNTVPNGQTLYARVDHDPAIVMGNTCAVIVEFDVIINPLPVVNPDRTDPYVFCEQEDGDDSMGDLILENIASEIALLQAPQVEGDFFISYHEDQSQAQTDDFALNSPYTFDENVFTGLWIRIENRVTGCFVVEFLAIVVEARPVAQQPEDLMVCEDIVPDDVNGIPTPGTATIDLTVQDEIIFGGPLGPTDQVNYFTSLADANLNMNAIVDPVNFINTSDPQTIWAVVEDTTTSCPSSPPVSFAIDVKEVPYTDLSDTGGEICVDPLTGEVLNPIVLDGTPETLVAGALYTYEWRLDGTLVSIDPTVTVTQVGTYEVTVTATYTDPITAMVHQCTYVADTFFTPVSAPLFQVEVVEDAFNPGGLYTVQVVAESITGFGESEYEFAIDDGPFQDGLVFTNVRPGTHTVFGRRVDGNCGETPVEIGIIDYPRFFTPNADGFHDTWNILGIGTAPNLNAKIYIFDRYGKLLKQLSPTSQGWNGTFNGQPMPSNDYWFRVEYNEIDDEGELVNKEFSGHFALKR